MKKFLNLLNSNGFIIETENSVKYGDKVFCLLPCAKNNKDALNEAKKNFEDAKLHPIFIYEDEFVNKTEATLSSIYKICEIENSNTLKIDVKKIEIIKINKNIAEPFINTFNVLGYVNTSFQFGAYFNNELISVMTFKKDSLRKDGYELSRYAIDSNYSCDGVLSKLFNAFINEVKPKEVNVFADRRWLANEDNNEFIHMGFIKDISSRNSYWYIDDKNKIRINKNSFNKQKLIKEYGFSPKMSELEMVQKLGYEKLWDLGYTKYVWGKKSEAKARRMLTKEEEERIVYLYEQKKKDTNYISKDVHVNKELIYATLDKYGIRRRKMGELIKKIGKEKLEHHNKIIKYIPKEGYTFVAVSKKDGTTFSDYMNTSGALSRYIKKEYSIEPPSFHMASVYYYNNESYWYEEYFDIVEKKIEGKVCRQVVLSDDDIKEIINLYTVEKWTCDDIASKYKIGKKKVYNILDSHNVQRRKVGELNIKHDKKDYLPFKDNPKYIQREGYHFVAISKKDGTMFNDYNNKGGYLTSYIRNILGIEVPTLHERRLYYGKTSNYWHEQFFDIVEYKNDETVKCPYCDYETLDVDNKSGTLQNHIKNVHKKTDEEVVNEFPEYLKYFAVYKKEKEKEEYFQNEDNYVVCPLCGEKLKSLNFHLKSIHNVTAFELRKQGYKFKMFNKEMSENLRNKIIELNKNNENTFKHFSAAELEIIEAIKNKNIECGLNRKILNGKEIDIFIPNLNIGFEHDGLFYHSEFGGKKDKNYHISKTKECLDKGVELYHIFEDDYINHKYLVLNKIMHLLHKNVDLPKIMGRKCVIEEIDSNAAKKFIEQYSLKDFFPSDIYLGSFYMDKLIAVMAVSQMSEFEYKIDELTSDYHYNMQGVCGKIFSYFIKHSNAKKVIALVDRRWKPKHENCVFEKLGFKFDSYTEPDYSYFISSFKRTKLVNKKELTKELLDKVFNIKKTLSPLELFQKAKIDRIWDCGSIKYIWKKD